MDIRKTALTDAQKAALAGRIDAHFEAAKTAYLENLKIPSIQGEPAPGAPFGKEVARAMRHAAEFAASMGLTAEILDDRIVVVEAGEGDEYVASIGHLDVVPVSGHWTHEPFAAEVVDGVVYARGALDDKSGSFASLLALAAIRDLLADGTVGLPRRVRVLLGGNEEQGMAGLRHYVATQLPPAFAIAPDTTQPCAQAEKGRAAIHCEGEAPTGGALYVERMQAGSVENVVPDAASAVLAGTEAGLAQAERVLTDFWDRNCSWKRRDDGRIEITAAGKSGHAARCFFGDSAAIRLLRTLQSVPLDDEKYWKRIFELSDPFGGGLGLADWDALSGPTTSNLGLLSVADGRIRASFDVRYPVVRSYGWVAERTAGPLAEAGLRRTGIGHMPPLYHAKDGPLIATILDVYEEEIGEGEPSYCMGGRTYASFAPNCVAIGRDHRGRKGSGGHDGDEHYPLEHLRGAARFLAHVLIRLAATKA
jgi:succinyl-diaminopimelate desuccinylase